MNVCKTFFTYLAGRVNGVSFNFQAITIQSTGYTYTTYNLQASKLHSVCYTYTTYTLQALKLKLLRYTYTTFNFQASNKSIKTLHLHNL